MGGKQSTDKTESGTSVEKQDDEIKSSPKDDASGNNEFNDKNMVDLDNYEDKKDESSNNHEKSQECGDYKEKIEEKQLENKPTKLTDDNSCKTEDEKMAGKSDIGNKPEIVKVSEELPECVDNQVNSQKSNVEEVIENKVISENMPEVNKPEDDNKVEKTVEDCDIKCNNDKLESKHDEKEESATLDKLESKHDEKEESATLDKLESKNDEKEESETSDKLESKHDEGKKSEVLDDEEKNVVTEKTNESAENHDMSNLVDNMSNALNLQSSPEKCDETETKVEENRDNSTNEKIDVNQSTKEEDVIENSNVESKLEEIKKPIETLRNVKIVWTKEASKVFVSGSFNNWEKIEMLLQDNHFISNVEMKPGKYEIKFFVDDVWLTSDDLPIANENNILEVE